MRGQVENLVGKEFERWTVISAADPTITKSNRVHRRWMCRCECGTERVVLERSLKNGTSKSCGCYHRDEMKVIGKCNKKHGMTNTRLYRIFKHMKNRCYNPNDVSYKNYGMLGITICDEWDTFDSFSEWALSHGYDERLSIDRLDVTRGYSPDNCRWTDAVTQANNKRNTKYYTYNGETHNIGEWAVIFNIPYKKLWKRINSGWDIQKALTT